MMLASALLVALTAQGPAQAVEQVDVAYEEMASGNNSVAIERIERNDKLSSDDPARLINLGMAYAREGEVAKARKLFKAALYSQDRQLMETAEGNWVDSRNLARRALERLSDIEGKRYAQVARAPSD